MIIIYVLSKQENLVEIPGFTVPKVRQYLKEAKGTGTKSLKQLELAFGALAKIKGQKVVTSFNPFGQKSTEAWLEKNGYVLNKGIYQKEFG